MKIAIGNDHTAIELKNIIKEFVEEKGYEVIDLGTNSTESCDYPIYGEKVGRAVADGQADLGIAICGTGVGISLAANKVKGIRACVCSEPYTAKPVSYTHLLSLPPGTSFLLFNPVTGFYSDLISFHMSL